MAEYTYNGRNQPLQTKVENGLFIATRGYDHAGRLLSLTNGTLDTTSYVLTPDGRRDTITRNSDTETYGYDNARQVSTATYGGLTTTQSWTYDAAGNRSTAITNGTTTNYAPVNGVNEYTTISGHVVNPTYDDNGNQLTATIKPPASSSLTSCVFTWDIHNQLISATNGAGDSATYQYDALGRRTRRSETISGVTTTTWFFTNGWNVELEHNGTTPTQRMTWGMDLSGSLQGAGGVGGLIMVEDLTGTSVLAYFPTYDGNGNITAWVDASGAVVARQRYDAFGNIIQQTGTAPSNYGFSTKPIEKVTGLLYYGYRYYDPITGRWPSRDPIEERGGVNLYGFVGNDGVNWVDVLGLKLIVTDDCVKELLKKLKELDHRLKKMVDDLESSKHIHTIRKATEELRKGADMGNARGATEPLYGNFSHEKKSINGEGIGTQITIECDPNHQCFSDKEGKILSAPLVTLAHELQHARDHDRGEHPSQIDPDSKWGAIKPDLNDAGIPVAEERAVRTENIARQILGMDQRNEYGGKQVTNPGPEHSPLSK